MPHSKMCYGFPQIFQDPLLTRWNTEFWHTLSCHDFTGLNQWGEKKWVSVCSTLESMKKYTHIMFSHHIHIKCAFHVTASLPF